MHQLLHHYCEQYHCSLTSKRNPLRQCISSLCVVCYVGRVCTASYATVVFVLFAERTELPVLFSVYFTAYCYLYSFVGWTGELQSVVAAHFSRILKSLG